MITGEHGIIVGGVVYPVRMMDTNGQFGILARCTDGNDVPVQVEAMTATDDIGILTRCTDGNDVPMKIISSSSSSSSSNSNSTVGDCCDPYTTPVSYSITFTGFETCDMGYLPLWTWDLAFNKSHTAHKAGVGCYWTTSWFYIPDFGCVVNVFLNPVGGTIMVQTIMVRKYPWGVGGTPLWVQFTKTGLTGDVCGYVGDVPYTRNKLYLGDTGALTCTISPNYV